MKHYPHTKATHIDWLGEIPSHWELGIGLNALQENKRSNKGMKESTVLSLSYGEIIVKDESKLFGLVPESFETYQIVEPNDIIIRCTDLQNDKTSLRTGLAKNKGIITSAYLNLGVKQGHCAKFIHYYLHTLDITKVIYGLGSGLRQNLSYLDFKRLPLPLPPLAEQAAIADYLDAKVAQIQTAIRQKQAQIDRLKEYRQALINQTVTKGLNPTACRKDSGVPWLGEVPSHWEVLALKRVARINPSVHVPNKRSDEKVCFLPMEKVLANGKIIDDTFLPIKDVSSGFTVFSKNDVIVAKITPCFENGKAALLDKLPTDFGYGSTEFHVLRPSNKILGKFLYLIIHSQIFLSSGEAMMVGSAGQKRVPTDFVANYKIALPPLAEQTAIAEFLDSKTAQIDRTLAAFAAQIDKLGEYQRRLVNDVVTGKIDVRQVMGNK